VTAEAHRRLIVGLNGRSLEVVRLLPIGKAAMAMVRTMTPASEVRRVNRAPLPADLLPG